MHVALLRKADYSLFHASTREINQKASATSHVFNDDGQKLCITENICICYVVQPPQSSLLYIFVTMLLVNVRYRYMYVYTYNDEDYTLTLQMRGAAQRATRSWPSSRRSTMTRTPSESTLSRSTTRGSPNNTESRPSRPSRTSGKKNRSSMRVSFNVQAFWKKIYARYENQLSESLGFDEAGVV